MRLLVINPNTTAAMTARIGAAASAAAARGTEIVAVNPSFGPASIEGFYDEAFAVPGLLDEIRRARGIDGVIVACFDDTGVDAARCLTDKPTVGICEAGMAMAALLATRFAVVTTLPRSIAPLERLAQRYGMADRAKVRAADVPVLALEDPGSGAREKLEAEIGRALDDGAEAILLGCAGMADLARALADKFEVPVVDGVAAAVKLIEGTAALGLRTSRRGAYAPPLAKVYTGSFASFAPPADS